MNDARVLHFLTNRVFFPSFVHYVKGTHTRMKWTIPVFGILFRSLPIAIFFYGFDLWYTLETTKVTTKKEKIGSIDWRCSNVMLWVPYMMKEQIWLFRHFSEFFRDTTIYLQLSFHSISNNSSVFRCLFLIYFLVCNNAFYWEKKIISQFYTFSHTFVLYNEMNIQNVMNVFATHASHFQWARIFFSNFLFHDGHWT